MKRGLPHGGPISYGFSGWAPVSDGAPPLGDESEYLVCAVDGRRSICPRGTAETWVDALGVPVIAWARIPMIDHQAFVEHYEDTLKKPIMVTGVITHSYQHGAFHLITFHGPYLISTEVLEETWQKIERNCPGYEQIRKAVIAGKLARGVVFDGVLRDLSYFVGDTEVPPRDTPKSTKKVPQYPSSTGERSTTCF